MTTRLGEKIESYCKANGLTYKQFAESLGVTYQSIYDWRKGKRVPRDVRKKLKALLGVSTDDVLGEEGPPLSASIELRVAWDTGKLAGLSPPPDETFIPVPVLDPSQVKIAGGQAQIVSREQIVDVALIHRRALQRKSSRGLFCLFVVGDSMEPALREGAIVCVDTNIKPGFAPPADSIWAVRVGDGPVVKHIQFSEGELWLLSENRQYPAKKATAGYEILGRVVWVWQSL